MSRLANTMPHTSLRQQSGFTLIEVLVSVLILAIGLVGVAGLQAVSLQNNQSSFMRSQATALAYDMADRMRSNVESAKANQYAAGVAAMNVGCKTTTGCSPQEMAQHDMSEWETALTANLPAGEGVVCIDSTPNDGASAAAAACDGNGSEFAIKIWWDDNRDGAITVAPPNIERLVVTVQL